ncbi:MAG: transposase [Methylocella sp.]
MQLDSAAGPGEPFPRELGMMIARVVEKDMDEHEHRIERLDRFQELYRRGSVNGQGLDHLGGAIVISDRGGLSGLENRRYESLDEKGDPLVAIAAMVLWESFQPKQKAAPIKGALRGREAARKNLAGRKRWDEIAVFKALALQALDNLAGDRAEYRLRDRLSFVWFLGLGLEDAVAGAKAL